MKRLLLLLLFAALGAPAIAAAPRAAGFAFGDWQVAAGEVDTNWELGTFSVPTPLTLTRPGSSMSAQRANGNFKTKLATLSGNVVLHDSSGALTNFSGNANGHQPATLTCDTLQIDGNSKVYTAIGRVKFSQGKSWANADRAVMNGITHDLHLFGHVILHQ